MAKFIVVLIAAFWVCLAALISVQNATPISLQFLVLRSIELPLGLTLALSAAMGMVGAALVLPLLSSRSGVD